jgi:hypothetical protein
LSYIQQNSSACHARVTWFAQVLSSATISPKARRNEI